MSEHNGKVHLVLDDEMLVEIWLGWARAAARIDSDLDVSEARRMLGMAAELVTQMLERIKELETPVAPPTTQSLGVPREPRR